MKKTVFVVLFLIFKMSSAVAEETLSLTVIDQNFNSTERIVIDQEAIKRSRATSLTQVLSAQANIVITSSNFQPNSVFVRGGDSSHVLFLIDDIPAYDASTLQKVVNLGNLNLSNIKRIEILKGSQSVLYGGQALSAVIKIYTLPYDFKNSGKVILRAVPGSSGEAMVGVDQVISDSLLASINVKYKDAQNPTPVLDSNKTYAQKTSAVDTAFVYKIDEKTRAAFKINYSNDDNQIPTTLQPETKAADTNDFGFLTRTSAVSFNVKNEQLYNLSFSHLNTQRGLFQDAFNSPDASKTDLDDAGGLDHARAEYYFPQGERLSGVAGLTYTKEKFKETDQTSASITEASGQYEGVFAKVGYFILPENLQVEIGARKETSKTKALADSYQIGFVFWKDLKLSYSTGFKAPSLAQLYSPSYGNPDLKAETSSTVNLLYDQKWTDRFTTSFAVFDSNYKDLMMYVGNFPTGKYQNVATSRTKGAELAAGFDDQTKGLNYQLYLAYQEPYDATTFTWLPKRPLQSGGFKLTKLIAEKGYYTFELSHTGERRDKRTTTKYVNIDSFTIVNFSAGVALNSMTEVFTRFDNLTNQTYQQSYGYYETGVKGSVGIQIGY